MQTCHQRNIIISFVCSYCLFLSFQEFLSLGITMYFTKQQNIYSSYSDHCITIFIWQNICIFDLHNNQLKVPLMEYLWSVLKFRVSNFIPQVDCFYIRFYVYQTKKKMETNFCKNWKNLWHTTLIKNLEMSNH